MFRNYVKFSLKSRCVSVKLQELFARLLPDSSVSVVYRIPLLVSGNRVQSIHGDCVGCRYVRNRELTLKVLRVVNFDVVLADCRNSRSFPNNQVFLESLCRCIKILVRRGDSIFRLELLVIAATCNLYIRRFVESLGHIFELQVSKTCVVLIRRKYNVRRKVISFPVDRAGLHEELNFRGS